MATKKLTINQFNGGVSLDKRSKDYRRFAIAKNFDVFTYPHKIEPTLALEDKTTNVDHKIAKFLSSPVTLGGITNPLLGFADAGGQKCAVYHWNGTVWDTDITNDTSSAGVRNEDVFFYYKGYVYMFGGTDKLKRFDADGGTAFEEDVTGNIFSDGSIAFTTVVQPVHHPNDDIAYLFTDNKVHKINDTDWTREVLELPEEAYIVAACSYGNYLAIATTTNEAKDKKSIVYLWDRDSSLTTISDKIDMGSGEIMYLANLNNKLTVVMFSKSSNKYKLIIKQVSGQFGVIVDEIISDTIAGLDDDNKTSQVLENKLYFPAGATRDDNTRYGIWEVNSNGKLNLFMSDDAVTDIRGIFNDGNNWWIAHDPTGTVTRTVGKTNPTYADAEIETLVIGEGTKNHKLIRVGVSTEALDSNDEIVLEYKLNENLNGDTWIEIFTESTTNSIFHSAINIESTGETLPEFREIQLRATSKEGAIITGIETEYEEIDDNL